MFRDVSASAILMGTVAAFVGFASSFAILFQGFASVGATPAQAASGSWPTRCWRAFCSASVSRRSTP